MEAGRDGGVVLDEGPSRCVPGKLLVDQRVVAQQASVCAEGDAANVTSAGRRHGT